MTYSPVAAHLIVFGGANSSRRFADVQLFDTADNHWQKPPLRGRASPRNQGFRYVVGVASAYFFFEYLAMDVLLASPAVLRSPWVPKRTTSFVSMYKLGLTRLILVSLCVAGLHRRRLEGLYAITGCAAWGALASFHAVLLVDASLGASSAV